MSTSISTRWKLLVDLPQETLLSLPSLFNTETGKTFIRSMGGRSNMRFSPKTLSCTTRFYELLNDARMRLGFDGRKLPFVLSGSNIQVNVRFRLYGPTVLALDVERSPVDIALNGDLVAQSDFWKQRSINELVMSILGLIMNPARGFMACAQRPKVFTCNLLVCDDVNLPDKTCLVKLLTRHTTVTSLVVDSVLKHNHDLQSDASTLLVDRQGVVAMIPASVATDPTTARRFPAAASMLELVAAVERMIEQRSLSRLSADEFAELDDWFSDPEGRFAFSVSSLHIWHCITAGFRLAPDRWATTIQRMTSKTMEQKSIPTILIVTAIEEEAAPSLKRLINVSTERRGGVFVNTGIAQTAAGAVAVFVCSIGVGNAKAIMNTTTLLQLLRPDLTVFCGIAGGRKEAVIGSVVVGNLVYNYESGKEKFEGLAPRPRHASLSPSSETLATAFLAKERNSTKNYEVFFKPIACGEKVVGTTKGVSATVIAQTYGDALAVEMEGFGFLSALERAESPALLVRGISDVLDQKDETEDHDLAIANATDLVFRLITFFAGVKPVSRI